MIKACVQCGNMFEPKRVHKRFCSILCRDRNYYQRALDERNKIKLEIKRKEREMRQHSINVIVGKVYMTDVPMAARPYLQALRQVERLTDRVGEDDGRYLVQYFLANTQHWCGEQARRIKAELRALLGEDRSERSAPKGAGRSDLPTSSTGE